MDWCERRLLARIHRLTLDGLRRRIEPVPPEVYWQYLVELHHLPRDRQLVRASPDCAKRSLSLQGFELPAGVWEQKSSRPAWRITIRIGSIICFCRASWFGAACGRREATRRRRSRHGGADAEHADLAWPCAKTCRGCCRRSGPTYPPSPAANRKQVLEALELAGRCSSRI